MQIMNFKNDVCDDKYFSLFAIKAEAEKIHNLALQLEIDKETREEWRQTIVLCSFLIDQLKQKPHQDAIKHLKLVFGGARGLNPENEKLAKKILKSSNSNAASGMATTNWGPHNNMMPQMMMGPQPRHHMGYQGRGFQGGCYTCGQFGHMAKDCFASRGPSANLPRGGRGNSRGRSVGGRFNHRGERKRGRNW